MPAFARRLRVVDVDVVGAEAAPDLRLHLGELQRGLAALEPRHRRRLRQGRLVLRGRLVLALALKPLVLAAEHRDGHAAPLLVPLLDDVLKRQRLKGGGRALPADGHRRAVEREVDGQQHHAEARAQRQHHADRVDVQQRGGTPEAAARERGRGGGDGTRSA